MTAATVGLSRRPLPQGPRQGSSASGDQADALLEAAALHVAARRAGVLPPRGVVAPSPMAPDGAPELPPRGTQIVRQAMKDSGLLADLLMAAAEAGYRAPAPLLPVLLDAAARTVALRPAVRATLGSRGRWLAAHRAEWRRAADLPADAGQAQGDGAETDGADDPRGWETGSRAERIAYLTALREHDPLAGRELLAAGWSRETAEERAQLLPVLSTGLSAADEEFLEAALDDRVAAVRAAARSLLARLPRSAFRLRTAARATAVLRLASDGRRHWLEAALPDGHLGPELARDAVAGSPPGTSVGARAWQLTQLIAAAPLDAWTGAFELGAGEIVSLEIRLAPGEGGGALARPGEGAVKGKRASGGLSVEVHAGWRLAALRQGDARWAMALLAGDGPLLAPAWPEAAWTGNHELAALLAPADRVSLAARFFTRLTREARDLDGTKWGSRASTTTIAELTAWPGPWPAALADYVLARVAVSLSAQGAARTLQPLVSSAARNIPVTGPRDYGAELIRLAHRPDCAYPWLAVLRRAADTLALRRDFHSAIGG